jgi:hypothetical protein
MSALPARTTDRLSLACVALGGASIVASIVTWATARGETPEETAHAERFGIFVGLWAPTFLILGDYLRRAGADAPR